MSDMESILMASTVEQPSATTTTSTVNNNNNNNNPNNKKPAASNVAAAASSSSATTSSVVAAASAGAATTTATTAVAGDETDALQQQKPAAASAAAAALIPTDPKTGHAPSAAGSVIEAVDNISGQTILIRIQNIASTANLGVRLDLKKIALKCRNTEFNPRRFGAVIMRLREPRATALLFASGKICVTGVKSTHNAQLACKKFHYIIERVGFKPKEYMDFKVQNVVGTADCGFPIRLEGLVYAHSGYASYEPELFPGLIYRLVNPRVVFLIFVSGKVVITGAKKESDLSTALTKLYPVLVEFKKATVAPFPPNVAGASGAAVAAAPGGGAMVPAAASTDLVAAGDKTKEKLMEEV